MIKFLLLKIVRFFYRLLSKIVYFFIPIISKIFLALRLNSRIINQLNQLRYQVHKTQNHYNFILKLLEKKQLVALDVGAQGGFFNDDIFPKKYGGRSTKCWRNFATFDLMNGSYRSYQTRG